MKRTSYFFLLLSVLLAAATGQTHGAPAEQSSKVPTRKEAVLVTVTASVEEIDYATRELTLKGPLGNSVSFKVDPRVKRLAEIKVGDLVQANYLISVAAELRKPTAEEAAHPLVVTEVAGKAGPETAPAAAAARQYKVVTTIEGLDRPSQTVTVKGPRGRTLTAHVENPDRLTEMRIGETIVITYTEALAISLEKLEKKT